MKGMVALAVLASCLVLVPARAGDEGHAPLPVPGTTQPFENARLPRFRDGRLANEILADHADAALSDPEQPFVHMTGVQIIIYESKIDTPDGIPAVAIHVSSERGTFERRPAARGRPAEEIAHLEGDVTVTRYVGPSVARIKATTIRCRYARWNHTQQFLEGKDDVEFKQGDSVITGGVFSYYPDRAIAADQLDSGDKTSPRDWGGLATISENVVMTITRPDDDDDDGFGGRTVVRCDGMASYHLDDRRIQFEEFVRVDRPGLAIATGPGPNGALRVMLGETNNVTNLTVYHEVSLESRPRPGDPPANHFSAGGDRADLDFARGLLHLSRYREADLIQGRRQWGPPPVVHLTRVGGLTDTVTDAEIIFLLDDLGSRGDASPRVHSGGEAGTLRELRASGGMGEARFAVPADGHRPAPGVHPASTADEPVRVRYRGAFRYRAQDGYARFEEVDELVRGDPDLDGLWLSAGIVEIVAPPDARTAPLPENVAAPVSAPVGLSAENDVRLRRGEWTATAEQLRFDPRNDTLILNARVENGRPIPPFSVLADTRRGLRFEAPELSAGRTRADNGRDTLWLVGQGGPSVCTVQTAREDDLPVGIGDAPAEEDRRAIRINADHSMRFDEARGTARFQGVESPVTAESTDPGDEFLLDCALLNIQVLVDGITPEVADAAPLASARTRLRWIEALGHPGGASPARLQRGGWVCTGAQIIQRERSPGVYVVQVETRATGPERVPDYPARLEENGGAGLVFTAPRLAADPNGDWIKAEGRGRLEMPDFDNERAIVNFGKEAGYIRLPGGLRTQTRFEREVRLTRKAWGLTLECELMDIFLVPEEGTATADAAGAPFDGKRRLERAEAYGPRDAQGRFTGNVEGVRIRYDIGREQTVRHAWGDWAKVEFRSFGAVLELFAHGVNRRVRLEDSDGFHIVSPHVTGVQTGNMLSADGPGEIFIPGSTIRKRPTRARFGDKALYSEIRNQVKLTGTVEIEIGNELFGKGDMLILHTRVRPDADAGDSRPPLEATKAELYAPRDAGNRPTGFVEINLYPPVFSARPDLPPERRPGDTVLARAERGSYEVESGKVTLEGKVAGHRPQVVFQRLETDAAGNVTRTRRTRGTAEDRLEYDPTRNMTFRQGRMDDISSETGPLRFDDTQ